RIMLAIGLLFLILQIALIFSFGQLFSDGPVPISPGVCGYPMYFNADSVTNGTKNERLGTEISHTASLFERASQQFMQCSDLGGSISCPGPAGQTFSWEISESAPSYCWFGTKNCYNGSRTITQSATIIP